MKISFGGAELTCLDCKAKFTYEQGNTEQEHLLFFLVRCPRCKKLMFLHEADNNEFNDKKN